MNHGASPTTASMFRTKPEFGQFGWISEIRIRVFSSPVHIVRNTYRVKLTSESQRK